MISLLLVYLGEPVAVENRPVETLLLIDVREVFESNHVNVFICPSSFFITNQPGKKRKTNLIVTTFKSLLSSSDVTHKKTYLHI